MREYEALLYPVFDYLQRHNVPLGVSEYELALSTLRDSGIADIEHLKRFCRLVWAKSLEDQELFDTAFAEFVEYSVQVEFVKILRDVEQTDSSISTSPFDTDEETVSDGNLQQDDSTVNQTEHQSSQEHGQKSFDSETELKDSTQHTLQTDEPDKVDTKTETQESSIQWGHSHSRFHKRGGGNLYAGRDLMKFHLTPRFPLGRREMAGAWRHLRRLQRSGHPEELDVEGTIHQVCQSGFFVQPVLQPRRRNQAKLLLLIDQRGSMSPFRPLVKLLLESILRGGMLGRVAVYYFHDCPGEYLYQQRNLHEAFPCKDILLHHARENSVLIISDAGAARGNYDHQRQQQTRAFLKELHEYTYLYAWLNPVPLNRWQGTTAEVIAHFVPMYPFDREGLHDAITILRGHPFPPGVNIDVKYA